MSKLESTGDKLTGDKSKDVLDKESSESNVDECEKDTDDIVEELPVPCNDCDLRFKTGHELSDHSISHHPKIKVLSCEECEFQSNSEKDMEYHVDGHRPYPCTICECRYANGDDLAIHMTAHIEEKPFACAECDSKFDKKADLTVHMNEHNGQRPYACTICECRYANGDDLAIHMTTHIEEKIFTCTECDNKFNEEADLTVHMNEHNKERLIACYVCDRKFTTRDELKMHMSSHNKNKESTEDTSKSQPEHFANKSEHKPYACTECDYSSASKAQCKLHIATHKTININERKPNACYVCENRFATREELKVHMNVHTEEKPFRCTECDYGGKDELSLQQHMNSHCGELPNFMSDAQFPPLASLGVDKKSYSDAAISFNDLARQHFVDTLFNKDGWSRPFMNGKQMKTKDMFKPNPVAPRTNNRNSNKDNNNNISNNNGNKNNATHNKNKYRRDPIIGTGKGSNLSVQNKKYNASLFATRYNPNTNASTIKHNLEANLLKATGARHIVTVEKITTKYDHYASFKISCSCDNTAVFKNSEIWPENILVDWWRAPRKGITNN